MKRLAEHYLAAPPADGARKLKPLVWVQVGPQRLDAYCPLGAYAARLDGFYCDQDSDDWMPCDSIEPKTRNDLRRLLAALGMEVPQ